MCFAGGYLRDPTDFSRRGNVVYEMIDTEMLDGLIIWSSSLSSYVSHESIQSFCDRYRPTPMVSIGMLLEGIPGIVLDSYGGMREALVHLIEVHGRRRLAFIRGPHGHRDADERYRAYLDVLQAYDLPLMPELISPHYKWFEPGGRDMVRLLLDERQIGFDAVVGVNDAVAVEAMEALQARGIRVPGDVSVVGFNDTPLSKVVTPPLTTVPWRMYERGQEAARLLLAMLTDETPPAQVLLPTYLIVRESCGCLDPMVARAVVSPFASAPTRAGLSVDRSALADRASTEEALTAGREAHLAAIAGALDEKERSAEWIAHFLDAFTSDLLEERSAVFLPTLERILRQAAAATGDIGTWQPALSALRREMLPVLSANPELLARAENLWHQARIMIGEEAQRARGYRQWLAQQHTDHLRRIRHVLATTTRAPDLMDVLAEELPHLGIAACYLALYEDPTRPTEWCRLALAYDENGRLELGPQGRRMLSRRLAMGCLAPTDKPYNLLIQPLYFQDEQLGLVVFEQKPAGDIYEVLREEIGVTLKAVMLAERNELLYQQALEAQQAAQEGRRLAEEADRLKSRFLSMVSHELRTPLVLLVGLSEMMLRARTGDSRPPLPEPYRQDLARIHVSAQQLDGLVRDVLDLTRSQMGQLRLAKEPLDLAQVLRAVALVGEQMARGKGLAWRAEIPDCLPLVSGDPARLRQVTLNLVANAVKFTTSGQVELRAEAGDGAITVFVSDTGVGVPQVEQEAIFDEFRQSERTAARGYGGLGIGLAICRELVELHGGQIGVSSSGEEEGGSTFFFTLPVHGDQAVGEPGPAAGAQVVLLLTEHASDDASAAHAAGPRLREHLVRQGFQVESLSIDESADWLARVIALAPGALVLDCQPASTRGWQLIETLKRHPATQDIPVLFYALQEDVAGAMLALDHLTKPVSAAVLAHAVQRHGLAADECSDARTILVVDDDPAVREMHTRVVQTALAGCRTLQASNGRMALETMHRARPALVLLDLMMPELDGMGVLAAMQEDEKLRGIPVIVLTGQTLTQDEMARLNRGVAAVLEKGLFSADETLAHIEQTLARNRRLGSETQRMVRKAMAYIHERYAEPLAREEVASYVGVSARHLTRCFQQEVGVSPIAYLSRYRVKKAKQLLEAGDKNVTEVAAAVGFSSSNYFADAFRREVGLSPRDYQRRHLAPKS